MNDFITLTTSISTPIQTALIAFEALPRPTTTTTVPTVITTLSIPSTPMHSILANYTGFFNRYCFLIFYSRTILEPGPYYSDVLGNIHVYARDSKLDTISMHSHSYVTIFRIYSHH
jgi:hypothetical protein